MPLLLRSCTRPASNLERIRTPSPLTSKAQSPSDGSGPVVAFIGLRSSKRTDYNTPMTTTDLALRGRTALITGGGSGIGLGAARWLVRDGPTVMLMGRTQARLDEAAASFGSDASI